MQPGYPSSSIFLSGWRINNTVVWVVVRVSLANVESPFVFTYYFLYKQTQAQLVIYFL